MNINQLLNIGNESAGYEGPKSLLDEMMEEIGFESDIDNAIYEAEAAAITASTSIAENVYVAMAEKECGVEGANPLEVYKDFGIEGNLLSIVGQEALTDVVKRRAYSGVAQLKSLINTIISWFKRLLGLSTNTKKIFKSLADKAKKIKKDVVKARANFAAKERKQGSDFEIEKEIPRYLANNNNDINAVGLNSAIAGYLICLSTVQVLTNNVESIVDPSGVIVGNNLASATNATEARDGRLFTNEVKERLEENIKSWKEDTMHDVTGDQVFNEILKALDFLYANRVLRQDIQKEIDRGIKRLEQARKAMESNVKSMSDRDQRASRGNANVGHEIFNEMIETLTRCASGMNILAKHYVSVADQLFTDAKWLIAKAL